MATLMCVRCDTGAPRCLSVLTAEKRDFPAQVREDGPCQDVRPKARSGFGVTLWGAYHQTRKPHVASPGQRTADTGTSPRHGNHQEHRRHLRQALRLRR